VAKKITKVSAKEREVIQRSAEIESLTDRKEREFLNAQESAKVNNEKMIASAKIEVDVETLTEPAEGDNEKQLALKKIYTIYYEQNPRRRKDNMEKNRLLRDLEILGQEGSQYVSGVIIKPQQ